MEKQILHAVSILIEKSNIPLERLHELGVADILVKKCSICDAQTVDIYDWYVQTNHKYSTKREMHTCPKCCGFPWVGHVGKYGRCDRCGKVEAWGIGKWNTNCGHVKCCLCEGTFCYECHDIVDYNK